MNCFDYINCVNTSAYEPLTKSLSRMRGMKRIGVYCVDKVKTDFYCFMNDGKLEAMLFLVNGGNDINLSIRPIARDGVPEVLSKRIKRKGFTEKKTEVNK